MTCPCDNVHALLLMSSCNVVAATSFLPFQVYQVYILLSLYILYVLNVQGVLYIRYVPNILYILCVQCTVCASTFMRLNVCSFRGSAVICESFIFWKFRPDGKRVCGYVSNHKINAEVAELNFNP